MKKNYLTLILPSLLSGCAGISGSNNVAPSDTPALVAEHNAAPPGRKNSPVRSNRFR